MSKTAGCLIALGMTVMLAAACGDDEGDGGAAAGASGAGGRAGTGGRAGAGGAAGRGGAAGNPSAGNGGASGNNVGGNAGTPAGNGGGGAGGAGGADVPDGGVDPDGGAEPDASPNDAAVPPVADCPVFATAAASIEPAPGQEVVIARVLFNSDGTAEVVLRNPQTATVDPAASNFPLSENVHLCSGPANCLIANEICDDANDDLLSGQETTCTIAALRAQGELAVLSNNATIADAFAFAYIQWDIDDNFVSPTPPVGDSLELRAINSGPNDGFWVTGGTIDLDANDDTIVSDGESVFAEEFVACTR